MTEHVHTLNSDQPSAWWLTDPSVFAVNRLAPHTDHLTADADPAYVANESHGSLKQSLDGSWKCKVVPAHLDRLPGESSDDRWQTGHIPPAFVSRSFDDDGFTTVEVPGCLETQGLMRPQYVNIQYPWDGHENPQAPNVPNNNHVALYRRSFETNERVRKALANGEHVSVTFHGAATAMFVWLNDTFIGYAEDSYTPSEFDVTDALRDGENLLAVACFEYSSASWLEDQDCWRFHGLFRSVELDVRPRAHVRDVVALADWDVAAQRGVLDVHVELDGARFADSVEARLRDLSGDENRVLWRRSLALSEKMDVTVPCGQVQPWSAESPNLYVLEIVVRDADGRVMETSSTRVGFKHVAIENGVLKLNGKRIVFRGVNRHEFSATRGRSVTEEEMLWDVRFMKRHNINAVRTSHYPNQTRWLELCDEYGLYVIDETNLETHGSWNLPGDTTDGKSIPGDDLAWQPACIDRLESMVRRDRNHASVIAWSLGNESYAGEVIKAMGERCRELDPSRPVHYEGVQWNLRYSDISDFETRMYAQPDQIREYLESQPSKPYISCEYMHAMGNSVGGLGEYIELERYPQYQGGFIWDFIDQALWQWSEDGTRRLAYGGDFNDRPNDGEFSADGIVFADRSVSPKAQEVKAQYANVRIEVNGDSATIHNGNVFTSTAGTMFVARVLVDGREVWSKYYQFNVPAGETRTFAIDFPKPTPTWSAESMAQHHEIVHELSQRLDSDTPWAQVGYELAWGQYAQTVHDAESPHEAQAVTEQPQDSAAHVTVGRWNAGMHVGEQEVLLSKTQGGVTSMRNGDRDMVLHAPKLVTWRPLTDNDRGMSSGFERAQWFAAGRYARVVTGIGQVDYSEKSGELAGEYWFELADPQHTKIPVRYRVRHNGDGLRMHVEMEYPGGLEAPSLPAFGLEWMLPERYSRLEFYGHGPQETYRDRKRAKLGTWSTTAFADAAPYVVPQETGNHEDVRWARITDVHGRGMFVESEQNEGDSMALSLLPYSTLMLEEATHQDELPQPRHMFLRMLAGQMGVGGDDSWGAPVHDRYLLDANKPMRLAAAITLI